MKRLLNELVDALSHPIIWGVQFYLWLFQTALYVFLDAPPAIIFFCGCWTAWSFFLWQR